MAWQESWQRENGCTSRAVFSASIPLLLDSCFLHLNPVSSCSGFWVVHWRHGNPECIVVFPFQSGSLADQSMGRSAGIKPYCLAILWMWENLSLPVIFRASLCSTGHKIKTLFFKFPPFGMLLCLLRIPLILETSQLLSRPLFRCCLPLFSL